ncbi:hypothetical protein CI109_105595 [Kwoniella shandongensis]|uniref:Uncharacterized protein n=1 Tax=Kwoniella shandongensis TaxID=1734106 RepID=A0A5M6C883_9TREE|nr:uncharacterized protein CI109_002312 [Kwoniella shandongensis]KAA5529419.1 hypothetical protein CI109_002312 [Kwoniella shandongensis]
MPTQTQTQPRSRSRGGNIVRYVLFALSFVLFLIALLLNIFLTGSIINLALHCAAGLLMLLYVPAAVILSAKDSDSRFDQAGVEVAYLTIQMALWLASGIVFAIEAAWVTCSYTVTIYNNRRYRFYSTICTQRLAGLSALGFIHFILLAGWLIWLAYAAHHTGGRMSSTQAFKLPTHRLVVGRYERKGQDGLLRASPTDQEKEQRRSDSISTV